MAKKTTLAASWTIQKILRRKGAIDADVWYQREQVWSKPQKQLFIDSILRGYDVPKLYFNVISKGTDFERYEIIDGKQRIQTILEFFNDDFPLGRNSEDLGLSKKYFSQIKQKSIEDAFYDYTLHITELEDADIAEVTELFRRLQQGSKLVSPEVLNSIKSDMREFCFSLTKHTFFKKTNLKTSRYSLLQVCAQIALIISKGPQNTKYGDLAEFFKENKTFDKTSTEAKRIISVLNLLDKAFIEFIPELQNRASIISLALLFDGIMEDYAINGREKEIGDFYVSFLKRLASELAKKEAGDPRMLKYNTLVVQAADSSTNIKERNRILSDELFFTVQDLAPKDLQRDFNSQQRIAIYRKNNGECQGKYHIGDRKVEFNEFHADHINPHVKGNPTTVDNGQVLCSACNLKKSSKEN